MKSQLLRKVSNLLEMLEQTPGKPGDLNHALQTITRTAQEFFAADDCVIFAIKSVMSRFTASFTLADGPFIEYAPGEQAESEDLIQQVLKKGMIIVEDLDAMPEYQIAFTEKEELRAFVALSLCMKYRQVPLGVLCLNFEQRQTFGPSDQELLRVFAERASGLLQETWLFSRLQKVARIGQEINQELDTVDVLFTTLQRHAAEVLDVSHALLLTVYQRQTSTLDCYLQEEGHLIVYEHTMRGACQYTMEARQTVFIEHLSEQAASLPFQLVHVPDTEPKESYIFVPLMFRDEPLGVLSIQHPDPYAYTQEDGYILELVASYIALAMHTIRLYRNLSQLNEAGGILTQQLDAKQTLQVAVDNIRDATRADLVVLYPYKLAHDSYELPPCIAGEPLDPASREAVFFNRPARIIMQMLQRKKPIFAKQSSHHTDIRQGSFGRREQVCSTAALPLWTGEEAVGVLFVNFRQPQRFDATQKLFIEGLARYAAVAMKNAQAFGMLSQRRLDELVILQHIDRELSRTLLELESFLLHAVEAGQ